MGENLDYLKMFAQFPLSLRRFLSSRLTLEDAQRIARERIAQRPENFLHVVEHAIYNNPRSPYLALLKHAQCEMGDLRALVKQLGLEGALRALRRDGVYINFEEFKGRKPLVRGALELNVTPRDFDNPFASRDFSLPTGGSTGAASTVGINLAHLVADAPDQLLALHTHELLDVPAIFWYGILPDFTPSKLLSSARINQMPHEWLSHMGWRDSKQWLKYDVATLYMLFWMKVSGVHIRVPQIVRVNDAKVVAQKMGALLKKYGQCLLSAQISHALRVALAAQEMNLDLTGATIRGGGEPVTPAKVRAIERSGARYLSMYSTVETAGPVALGCAKPFDGSDVHLSMDAFALVTHPHVVQEFGVTVPAFHFTTLLPTAPKVMLNVQMDDYGIVEERACGCELESYGYTTHLRQIRSYSKLTGEGVTLIGNELIHILETVMPERFGGTPQDYQLLEEEDEKGLTRLSLIISPRVNLQNEDAAIETLLHALRESSRVAAAAEQIWQQAKSVRVKRMEPIWTGRGKLMPLHLARSNQNQYDIGKANE